MVAATLSLPLAAPLVQSHLFYAYPLAILAGRGDGCLPWILSTFVQLYHRTGGDLKFYVHPWSPADHLRQTALSSCPWLDVQHIDQRLPGTPVVPFLERCIERGLYPQIDIDYGCLPGDPRGGWLHEIMLCGLDRQVGVFEVLAYSPRGVFHTFRVDAETIETAAAAAARLAREQSFHDERPRLLIYRFVDDARPPFDVGALCDQLWDYLEPADSSSRHRAIAPAIDALWGAGTFTWLESEVLADGAGESTEPLAIPLRVWWEHKRLMALRFLYLEREGYLDPALGASAEARRIAGIAWQARLIALRRRQGDSEGTERIVALLRASAARELDTAGDVVHALSDGSRHRSAA
jgi:hypothetical protein